MPNMTSTIAIHRQVTAFSRPWAELAKARGLDVAIVDAHAADFLEQIRDYRAFLWHLNHVEREDVLHGPAIVRAAEEAGVSAFPNAATAACFDDKLVQARLFAAAGVPVPRTWIFTRAHEAEAFVDEAIYPLVFKLRRGAGSANVRKVDNRAQARRLIARMFGTGMNADAGLRSLASTGVKQWQSGQDRRTLVAKTIRAGGRILRKRLHPDFERGYALFQEFIPDCDRDVRVTVIGDRAFTYERRVRANDFRASGSGLLLHLQPSAIPMDMVELAFSLSRRWGFQSMAYDFIRGPDGAPRLVEMCYVFVSNFVRQCEGYMRSNGEWRSGHFQPEALILDDLLAHDWPMGNSFDAVTRD